MIANGGMTKEAAKLNRALKEAEKKVRQMEKELICKEKTRATRNWSLPTKVSS